MTALGIDIGATCVKSAILSKEGLTDVHRTPFPDALPNGDGRIAEMTTESIWQAVQEHLKRGGCTDLFICNQMAGFVPMRAAKGYSLADITIEFAEAGHFVSCWDRRCGVYRKTANDIVRQIGWTGFPVNIGDWLAWRLDGSHDVRRVHPTNWCAVDAETSHNGLMRRTDGDVDCIGRWGSARVWRPVGDHAASVHGCDLGPDELSVNLGTGGQVSMIDHGWGEGPRLHQVRPGIGCQLQCVTHLPAGAWLKGWTREEQAVVKWVGHAARNLRPFSGAALSSSVAIYLRDAIEAELVVPCRAVEDAALWGLLRIAKEVQP